MQDFSGSSCPLCGSESCYTRLADGPNRVVNCTACGVVWRLGGSPAASPARIASTFEARLIASSPGWDGPPMNGRDAAPNPLLTPHLGLLEIEQALELKRPPGTLLNVGQDSLDFLESAKICGWNAVSVADLSALPQQAALILRDPDNFQEESDPGGYDVIRLENIIERAHDPVAAIRRISQFQNQGGLLIISGPNAASFDYPLYGEGASLMPTDLPRWFFTPKSLGLIMRRAGFSIVRMKVSHEPHHLSIFARRSMRQQYRSMRRWIDPQEPRIQPHRQRSVPA